PPRPSSDLSTKNVTIDRREPLVEQCIEWLRRQVAEIGLLPRHDVEHLRRPSIACHDGRVELETVRGGATRHLSWTFVRRCLFRCWRRRCRGWARDDRRTFRRLSGESQRRHDEGDEETEGRLRCHVSS